MKDNTHRQTNGTEKQGVKVTLNLPVQTNEQTIRLVLDLLGLENAPLPSLETIDEFHLILTARKGGKSDV